MSYFKITCFGAVLGLALVGSPAARAQMSTEQEVALGREASARFEAKYGLVNDAAMQARAARIGARLIPYCGRTDVRYSFRVANMEAFNALAFPGGFIYVTRGAMQLLDDSQLAFVLGHELTHVAHRHSAKQMSQDKLRQMGLLAALLAMSGGQVSSAQVQVAQLVDKVVGSQYSQADEADADATGIQTMASAGFDPAYSILALRTLAKQSGGTPDFLNTLVGSHPMPADRIRDALDSVPGAAYQPVHGNAPVDRVPLRPLTESRGLDVEWTQTLSQDIATAAMGPKVDPVLSRQLQQMLRQKKAVPTNRRTISVVGAETTLAGYETRFLSKELPALAQRNSRFGLAVLKKSDGSREVYIYWP